ncbi:MAG: hydrogenase iron-sulfur subunit [Chloroflexi bacterium]|nr:hydrogenase iron-sulfur subunit [Chloroflexota bacterium]
MVEVGQDKMKLRFSVADGEVSRRELFTAAWPRYEVIPYIDTTKCLGCEECGLCVDGCLLGAVRAAGDEAAIDTALCSGCGACVERCPSRAVVYPTFTLEKLDREMEELLLSEDGTFAPKVIAAVCQNCLPTTGLDKVGQLASNVGILSVPCLAMASPWLILRAFDRGAGGFALVSSGDGCHSGYGESHWQGNVQFVREVLSHWNIEAERIRIVDAAKDEIDSLESKLGEFAREIDGRGSTPLVAHQPTPVPDDGLRLPVLLQGMSGKLGVSLEGVIRTGAVPFGRVALDASRCTGCSLCAVDCPTGAMAVSASEDTGAYRLLFEHGNCVACGKCVEICPEDSISLELILAWCEFGQPAAVLFMDSVVRCAGCGEPIGTRAMLDNVKARLMAGGQYLPDRFELCPVCKVKAQFESWGTVTEQIG